MKTIEEKLQEYKRVQAPSELEGRLRDALQRIPAKKRNMNKAVAWVASAVAALIMMVGLYEYPAFAYYGSKLFNGASLNSLSFSELKEQGYGQQVNKSTTFKDGTVFTINGVIADDNVFTLYYTIDRPAGTEYTDEDFIRYHFSNLKGFLTDSNSRGGGGNPGKDKSQFVGVHQFEPVSPFSRTLTLTFNERLDNGERVSYPISFDFDANKAMKSIIKEDLSETIPVDQGKIHYDSITASPSSTIVKGHYELEGSPRFSGETKLYVNGTEVKSLGMKATSPEFELKFDVLPTDKIQSIELVLEDFTGIQKIEKPISLASPSDHSINVGQEKVWIRSVTKTDTGYDIVIAGNEFVFFEKDNISIQAGGSVVPVSEISSSRPWDLKNGNIMWEQTYSFNTTDKPEFLLLDELQYIKAYNKKISIPVNNKK
ncbi:DUF4179 domain-containing protein [Paenibacillus chitinolyticus]|uniref:DUF4179 domain-containing protein n=1 Tax=Paenibacillus chitinolyticus TaxID=79263 RepID=UPI001C4782E8|nr:DUF4179 domain-containing protein [Paenibacillus chitinolyticus]MBV6714828.1 DUF4179 domain-containing protein [Paenibacillus chitinolyticus]